VVGAGRRPLAPPNTSDILPPLMFHIVTVHWRTPDWIEPQLRFVRRHFPDGTRVYASLNGIDAEYRSSFAYAEDLPGTHPEKLNALAAIVSEQAAADDHLVFIDGDAFPIAPITPEILQGTPLTAVRRDENLGDPQPHPCFAVTTVGFWNSIAGDWRPGYTWVNALGYRTTDVGANLLHILRDRNIQWRPLLRSNRVNLHPLWFGIYGDVVYHHGAGFRGRVARSTLDLRRARVPAWIPVLRRYDKQLALRAAMRRRHDARAEALAESARAREILDAIRADHDFPRALFGMP
jgi:hypothetical protein